MGYGIGLDWVGDERPDYMRTGEFIPCDCKKCYFCLNGHTTGIAHAGKKRAPVVEYKCGTRARTKRCSTERVNLNKNSKYCKMCYRKQGDVGTVKERTKKCNASRLGCVICEEHICKDCWDSGYDRHQT